MERNDQQSGTDRHLDTPGEAARDKHANFLDDGESGNNTHNPFQQAVHEAEEEKGAEEAEQEQAWKEAQRERD